MAAPGIPQNFNLQTANATNYLSWDLAPGATSYDVKRSLDGVTYASYATPTNPEYLDSTVTIGTQYWYQVAAINTDGTSPYTLAQSCVPVPTGDACLGQIRMLAQQTADRVNSNFVTLTEWNTYINQSLFELYDILITQYGEEYFAAPPAQFSTSSSTVNTRYPLPNGVLTFQDINGADFIPEPFYKLIGVDVGVNAGANGWITAKRFNFIDRNKFFYPTAQAAIYGIGNLQYRLVGDKIELIPVPAGNTPVRLWYIPRMRMLLKDTDITSTGVSGWWQYAVVDAAIKALNKEESDTTVLMKQKSDLYGRITIASMNRDAGQADTISDTRSAGWGNGGQGSFGAGGGPW